MERGCEDCAVCIMKKKFSTHWRSSKQKRKQRKYRFNAPLHLKHKFLNTHLSKELRKKHGKKNIPIRKGDEVIIMRGSFKKKKVKVTLVDHKRARVSLENIQRSKKDGAKVNIYFHPSNLQIVTLNLDDKKRNDALNRKTIKKTSLDSKKTEDREKKNASDTIRSK